jgi:gliding motility associated protien GldN
MKKLFLVIVALLSLPIVYAYTPESAFDANGDLDLTTYEYDENINEFVEIFHSKNDMVWSKVVYRIVDLRFKQNYKLYTPVVADDPNYSSLFRTILHAIEDDMPVYARSNTNTDIKPNIAASNKLDEQGIFDMLSIGYVDDPTLTPQQNAENKNLTTVMKFDANTNDLVFNSIPYENYAKNVVKYLIQEIVFFDKHYSTLERKIVAIAPMYPNGIENNFINGQDPIVKAIHHQILFWIPFAKLRPYLAQQAITPNGNDATDVATLDMFFEQRKYSSYIVGDENVYSRMVSDKAKAYQNDQKKFYEAIRKEQEAIEESLLNVENDLWEY